MLISSFRDILENIQIYPLFYIYIVFISIEIYIFFNTHFQPFGFLPLKIVTLG